MASKPSGDPAKFWAWFEKDADDLRQRIYGDDPQDRAAAMHELGQGCPDFTLELMQVGDRPQLIVSADGDWEKVDGVKEFVATAPKLKDWDVGAFRPRMGGDLAIEIQGESISPEDIRFQLKSDDSTGSIDVTLFVRGLNKANEEVRGFGAGLLAQHAIGEEDAITLIGSLVTKKPPWLAFLSHARPFSELHTAFEELKQERFPAPGSLQIDDSWQAMEGELDDRPVIMLLNQGLQPFSSHPQYDRCLTVDTFFTEDDVDEAMERTDRISDVLGREQQTLLALITTCVPEGRRTLTFYTSDEQAALATIEQLREEFAPHEIQCEVEWDTFWSNYLAFCEV